MAVIGHDRQLRGLIWTLTKRNLTPVQWPLRSNTNSTSDRTSRKLYILRHVAVKAEKAACLSYNGSQSTCLMSLAMLAGLSQAHQSNYRCRPTLSVADRESTREPLRARISGSTVDPRVCEHGCALLSSGARFWEARTDHCKPQGTSAGSHASLRCRVHPSDNALVWAGKSNR